jgi:hypothetical protein
MKKLIITLGQDLSAYATIEVPAETDLSDENLAAIARKAVEDEGAVFDEDWSTVNALRIVLVQDEKGQTIRSDVPVESSCHEGGAALQLYLRGAIGIEALVNSAIDAKLIDSAGGGAALAAVAAQADLLAAAQAALARLKEWSDFTPEIGLLDAAISRVKGVQGHSS